MIIDEIYDCETLEDFFKNKEVKRCIKEKNFDDLYSSVNEDIAGLFTEALYKSGINPFKYIKDYDDTGKFVDMFDGIELDEVILPKELKFITNHMFKKCYIDKLIILGENTTFDTSDGFFDCRFNEIHVNSSTLFSKKSVYQYHFYNRHCPLRVYINKVLPEHNDTITYVKNIFRNVDVSKLTVIV